MLTTALEAAQSQEHSTLLLFIVRITASFALVYGVWQLGNSWMRRRVGHWGESMLRKPLRRELCFVTLIAALGAGGLAVPPTPLAAIALAAALIVMGVLNDSLQKRIARLVEDEGLVSVTDYIGDLRPFDRTSGNDESVVQAGQGPDASLPQRIMSWCYSKPQGQIVSRLRLAASAALFLFALGTFATGATGFARRWLVSEQAPEHRAAAPEHRAAPHRKGPRPVRSRPAGPAGTKGTTEAAPSSPPAQTWTSVCGPNAEPGHDAPEVWARTVLYALYLGGPAAPPGTISPGATGGCTGHVVTPAKAEHFHYVVASIPATGERRSVAVASKRFHSALFVAPAVDVVLELIARYGEIGGLPRIELGKNGDCYAVETPVGTIMLVRAEKTTGPSRPGRYVKLMPAVVHAWRDAIAERGDAWLWPLAQPNGDGTTTFRLAADPIAGRSVATIIYDDRSGIARRYLGTGVREYGPKGVTIAWGDLLTLAAGIP